MANLTVACAVRTISRLGLRVAPQKTEAVFFHDGKSGAAHIKMGGTLVPVGDTIKYLGLHLDGR